MKIRSFRIKNYKSIIDSGECRLSDFDNITILAGQNESGKSSILQALRDFESQKLDTAALRDDDSMPEIVIQYRIEKSDIDKENFFNSGDFPDSFKEVFDKIDEIKVARFFNSEGKCTTVVTISNEIYSILKSQVEVQNEIITERNELGSKLETSETSPEKLFDTEEEIQKFVFEISYYTPQIIFFDDFCDLLPDKILINDLVTKKATVKGFQAVKNIETILETDFTKLDTITDGKRERAQSEYHEIITAKFNEKWKQRIAEADGAKIHVKYNQGKSEKASYLTFFIETKKGEYLPVSKRSQGFKWFLSFYLHLKAENQKSQKLIILFDEPGLYLHSKAQSDMISVFEELSIENQIIYSTHSPYLIDTTKLHRVRLVLNTKRHGTTIEKITSKKIQNQKEALRPIIGALGLEVATPFSVAIKNNVILEGISDFHYMQAMKILLGKDYDIGFLPSMGAPNVHLLMELCIGWGLNWVIIFDDKGATKSYNNIKKNFFNDNMEETDQKIFILRKCEGIEDVFSTGDLKLVLKEFDSSSDKKNSEIVNLYGGKELFARLFFEKVTKKDITKEKLSITTVRKFEEIFTFIEKALKI